MTPLLTSKEVEANYKIPESTLRKYRVYGKGFKYVKIGGKILYRVEDIEEYIKNHIYSSTTQQQHRS